MKSFPKQVTGIRYESTHWKYDWNIFASDVTALAVSCHRTIHTHRTPRAEVMAEGNRETSSKLKWIDAEFCAHSIESTAVQWISHVFSPMAAKFTWKNHKIWERPQIYVHTLCAFNGERRFQPTVCCTSASVIAIWQRPSRQLRQLNYRCWIAEFAACCSARAANVCGKIFILCERIYFEWIVISIKLRGKYMFRSCLLINFLHSIFLTWAKNCLGLVYCIYFTLSSFHSNEFNHCSARINLVGREPEYK